MSKLARAGRRAALAALTLLLGGGLASPAEAQAAKPNIVFILVDDLDAAMAQRLPRVRQRLAVEGTRFDRAYAEYGLCSPSRATMLTGRYGQNTGVRRNAPPFGGYQGFVAAGNHERAVNRWLQAAGYRTGIMGKLINGYPNGSPTPSGVLPGWDAWYVSDVPRAYGYKINENGTWRNYGSAPADYSTDVLTAKARSFIQTSIDQKKPFALFLWYGQIHSPVIPAARHAGLFPGERAPRLPNFNEADQSDKPPPLRLATRDAAWVAAADTVYRSRLRSAQAIAEALELIVRDLEARRQLANTFIVLTSDNGFQHGEHRFSNTKSLAYEESVRLPLYVRGPGVRGGRVISRLVSNADLAPTFAAWAGAAAPADVDGRSFAGLLTASDPTAVPWRRALRQSITREPPRPLETVWRDPVIDPAITKGYGCVRRSVPPQFGAQMRSVRTERYAFTHQTTGDMELYDRVLDPWELDNAICSTDPVLRGRLRDLAARLDTCRGAACRALEDTAVP